MIKFLLYFMLALNVRLSAAQYIEMDSTTVISVSLSSKNHNRIGIVGDRIKKAFFRSSNISVDVEDGSGQLFIQAMRPNCPSTTLSIISISGMVQELELCFSDVPSEIVLLHQSKDKCLMSQCIDEENISIPIETLADFSISDFVEEFIRGVVPEGYSSIEDQDSSPLIKNGLKFQRVSRLVNNQQIVFVYRLQNVSSQNKSIKECQVNILDGDWVFLDRYTLKPNECGLMLIGCIR